MGLGGYLTWTAAVREIKKHSAEDLRIMPVETHGHTITKVVKSPVFENNPNLTYDMSYKNKFYLSLNRYETNYCKQDLPHRAIQRYDKHIIEQICEFYQIENPELKCELFLTEQEHEKANHMLQDISKEFIMIEPHSKRNYTPNRAYPFKKWQNVVDKLTQHYEVIQVGFPGNSILENVTDFTGKTTFREAAALMSNAKLFLSTEGGLTHTATAVDTTALVVLTGYQGSKMVSYPQNININIATHGPCGLKIPCESCIMDAERHNQQIIVERALEFLDNIK